MSEVTNSLIANTQEKVPEGNRNFGEKEDTWLYLAQQKFNQLAQLAKSSRLIITANVALPLDPLQHSHHEHKHGGFFLTAPISLTKTYYYNY